MYALVISGMCFASVALGMMGCAGDQPAALVEDHEPVGTQLLRAVPSLRDERFSTLLDFESRDDAVFCSALTAAGVDGIGAGVGAITNDRAHTGRASFRLDSAATRFSIKLDSLLACRPFPGEWTLVGGYFFSDQATKVTVQSEPAPEGSPPRQVDLPAGAWTAVFTEIPPPSTAKSVSRVVPALRFDFDSPHGPIWCDDVMLVNNYKPLADSTGDSASAIHAASEDVSAGVMPPWTLMRRGLNYVGLVPGRFNFQLVTSETSPSGWIVDDANAMRALFHSNASVSSLARTLAIYSDGRAFWNGEYKPMSVEARDPTLEAQHSSPARIEVSEGMGRVDRNTPGDANNDGYNETTGSYRIIATGPRIELQFIPTKSPVLSPILEISGLPLGKALVTLEGRLVEQSARTSAGALLVELPARIDRPVTVDVRIEE
jgi:hypothetical protein